MKQLLIFLSFLLLTSCSEREKPLSKSKHGNFEVEFLFEIDSCKVYRFYDYDAVYITDCKGQTKYVDYRVNGKVVNSKTIQNLTLK